MTTISDLQLLVVQITCFFCCLATATAQGQEIRLGMVGPLSGDYAAFGRHVQRGVQLAAEEMKELAKITVFYEDACIPKDAVTAFNKLISVNHVNAVVGSYCVAGLVPNVEVVNKNRIITLHSSPVPEEFVVNQDYVFTTNAIIEREAERLAEYAVQVAKFKRVSIIYLDSQWGQAFSDGFSRHLKQLGGTLAGVSLVDWGFDFRAELTLIHKQKPDAIFAVHLGTGLGTLIKQARQLGLSAPFLSVDESEEQSLFDVAGAVADGLTIFSPDPGSGTEPVDSFMARFKQRFGHEPHILSSNSYDATTIAVKALLACKKEAPCARDRISALGQYQGVSGQFTIAPDHSVQRNFVKKIARNGRFETVK